MIPRHLVDLEAADAILTFDDEGRVDAVFAAQEPMGQATWAASATMLLWRGEGPFAAVRAHLERVMEATTAPAQGPVN